MTQRETPGPGEFIFVAAACALLLLVLAACCAYEAILHETRAELVGVVK